MRLAAAIAAIAFGVVSGGAASEAADSAQLRLLDLRPLQVRGEGFEPAERVVVRLALANLRRTRIVSATRAGAFVVTFRGVAADRCTDFTVTARGGRGSRAVLRNRDLTECPQPQPEPERGHGCFAFSATGPATGGSLPSCHPVRVP